MPAAFLAALAISLAEGQLSAQASIGLEGRDSWFTHVTPGAAGSRVRELELTPTLGAGWRNGALNAELAYRPRLWVSDGSGKVAAFHRAVLNLAWATSRDLTLRVGIVGGYGETDTATVAAVVPGSGTGTGPVTGGPIGQLGRFRYTDNQASLGADLRILPTLQLALTGGYAYRGGYTAADRASTPLERGPGAEVKATWRTDARNELATDASFERRSYLSGALDGITGQPVELAPAWFLRLSEGWSSVLGPEWTSRVVLGGALTSGVHGRAPVAEAGLDYRARSDWKARVRASLTPYIDPITAQVYDLLGGGLALGGPLTSWLGVAIEGMGGESVSGVQKGQLFGRGEFRLHLGLDPHLDLSTGLRLFAQRAPSGLPPQGIPLSSFIQWTAFVAMEWRPVGVAAVKPEEK